MLKKTLITILTLISFNILNASRSHTEGINEEMKKVYSSYKDLQKYIYSAEKFEDDKNKEKIKSDLYNLSKSFHKIDEVKSVYKNTPGFKDTLQIVQETLESSYTNFNSGKASFAHWQLRSITNLCATCHFTYNVGLKFDDNTLPMDKLSKMDTGNFYYATRQYEKASKAYIEVAKNNKDGLNIINALKRWLIVQVKSNSDSKATISTLEDILKSVELPSYEEAEVRNWIASLKIWAENPRKLKTQADAENIIKEAISADPLNSESDEVSLLKATTLLHTLLPDLSGQARSKALLDLGRSYYKLSSFFMDELPEIYLELAIKETPGSKEAKSAFNTYKAIVEESYTGSGGTHLPPEVRLKLIELWELATGEKRLTDN